MRLSDHFTLEEMCKSATAVRQGIDNLPAQDTPDGQAIIEALTQVCLNILEPVRTHFGIPFSPSSGYRCLELNRALKSKDTPQHVKGQAVDFELPGIANFDLAEWIRENQTFDQLILEFYTPGEPNSGWVHCSFIEDDNRGSVLTIGKQGTFEGLVR